MTAWTYDRHEYIEDHPRRCQHVKKNGQRCRKWAVKDMTVCRTHGGWRKDLNKGRQGVRINHLPEFYKGRLSKTLQEHIDSQLNADVDEQLNLLQELALMRSLCGDALEMHRLAEEKGKDDLKLNAAVLIRDALNEVRVMCDTAVKVETARKDSVSPLKLKQIVHQIVRIMYEVCGDEHEHLARDVEEKVRDQIRVPADITGTDLDPTQDVQRMIDSVPYSEDEE